MNIETATQIVSYFEQGNVVAGDVVAEAVRENMSETGEKDYGKSMTTVHRKARAEIDEGFDEFGRRGRSYASHFRIGGSEAIARVQKHDKAMAHIYELDPMRATQTVGIQPEPAVGKVTIQPWMPPVHEEIAVIAIANLLFGLPRDENMYVTLDQCASALKPYPDPLHRAAGDKFDGYARAEIHIQGMPGSVSDNYPRALEAARRRYPALADLWATGRLTSQALRELLPQILIRD